MKSSNQDLDALRERAAKIGLHGLVDRWNEVGGDAVVAAPSLGVVVKHCLGRASQGGWPPTSIVQGVTDLHVGPVDDLVAVINLFGDVDFFDRESVCLGIFKRF